MIRLLLPFIALLGWCSAAAQQASFYARASATKVSTQQIFEVTFTLENARGSNFVAPDFKCFDFISGPAQSVSTSSINGRVSQEMGFTYSLMRTRAGSCTIGPASIQVGGKTLRTDPITIQFEEGKASSSGSEEEGGHDVFLRAAITDQAVYPGQQVRLDYKVYTTVNVRNFNTLREDDYDQFYYRYVQDFGRRASLEDVDGTQYTVQTIRSIALFPQQTGRYVLDPLIASLNVSLRNDRPSFIFGTRTVPVNVASDSIHITVKPLPPGAPASFTGAVGTYRLDAAINKQQLTTDDAVVLRLSLTGTGDPKRWTAPDLSYLSDTFELYDPRITTDEAVDQGGEIRHVRTIEYLMVPRKAGNYDLQIPFSYFDPDSVVYRTLHTPKFHLTVGQGSATGKKDQVYASDVSTLEVRELKAPGGNGNLLFIFSPLYFIFLLLPLAGLGYVFWKRRELDFLEGLTSVEKKRRQARKIAEKYLVSAEEHLDGNERQYYDNLSRAIFLYLAAKLNIPVSELSKANVQSQLLKLGIPDALRDETMGILNTAEQILYAGSTSGADRRELYNRAKHLIEEVEVRT